MGTGPGNAAAALVKLYRLSKGKSKLTILPRKKLIGVTCDHTCSRVLYVISTLWNVTVVMFYTSCSGHSYNNIPTTPLVQSGILLILSLPFIQGIRMVLADKCWNRSLKPLMDKIRTELGDMPVYLTFDIDSLEPSACPGTGHLIVLYSHISPH